MDNWFGNEMTYSINEKTLEMHTKQWEKRPLVRPGHKWEDNITVDFREIMYQLE
jgi:hypothetical protein